jgi:hypothetical protein
MLACPKCKSAHVHRSRTKSRWEAWRKDITGKRPYRCRACGWRGWAIDSGPKFGDIEKELAERALAPEPPNLKGIVLSREESRGTDVSLAELDTLTPIGAAPGSDPPDSE